MLLLPVLLPLLNKVFDRALQPGDLMPNTSPILRSPDPA